MSKDYYKPTARGVGFLGIGKYLTRVEGIKTKQYLVWYSMLTRCYADNYHASKAYKDITVCVEWHNFQNFAAWFDVNYIEGYQLDKDKLVKGNTIYSPTTCCFISKSENITLANTQSREYSLKSPEGLVLGFNSIKLFCEEHSLDRGSISNLLNNKAKSCKGWVNL